MLAAVRKYSATRNEEGVLVTTREKISDALLTLIMASAVVSLLVTLDAKMAGVTESKYFNLVYFMAVMSIYCAVTRLMRLQAKKFSFQPMYLFANVGFGLGAFWAIITGSLLAYIAWGLSMILVLRVANKPEPRGSETPDASFTRDP
jgi:hypothetical protein